jgi:hypothetical protein
MTELELIKNVDLDTSMARYAACKNCSKFLPSAESTNNIIDAVTGETTTVTVQSRDTCSTNNMTLEGYISMTHSTCPEDLWK